MEENKFSNKQIANWRRIRVNIESDLNSLQKLDAKIEAEKAKYDEKIQKLLAEADEIRKLIEFQEYPVKMATGGFTTQDIFVKEVVVNDKVTSDGRTLRKSVYSLRYPDTILPPQNPAHDMGGACASNNGTIEEHNEIIY